MRVGARARGGECVALVRWRVLRQTAAECDLAPPPGAQVIPLCCHGCWALPSGRRRRSGFRVLRPYGQLWHVAFCMPKRTGHCQVPSCPKRPNQTWACYRSTSGVVSIRQHLSLAHSDRPGPSVGCPASNPRQASGAGRNATYPIRVPRVGAPVQSAGRARSFVRHTGGEAEGERQPPQTVGLGRLAHVLRGTWSAARSAASHARVGVGATLLQ